MQGLCVFVAALLQYLFTAVFFWMLCEGIMIYLMLVIVFSDVAKKWWIFFIIGWGRFKDSAANPHIVDFAHIKVQNSYCKMTERTIARYSSLCHPVLCLCATAAHYTQSQLLMFGIIYSLFHNYNNDS